MRPLAFSVSLLLLTCSASAQGVYTSSPVAPVNLAVNGQGKTFEIFDGLLYMQKPDLRPYGLLPIGGSGNLWRSGVSQDTVDAAGIQSAVEPYRGSVGIFYLDIETWPLEGVAQPIRDANIAKLIEMADDAHGAAPNMRIGFYGLMPGIVYWPLMLHDSTYSDWISTDAALDGLASHVDVVFPSLYTFYDDVDGWKSYARQTLTEARRYGKPVYAFLWPQYHDSNPALRGQYIPASFWRTELELCYQFADGIVLWGGWQQSWDDNAPWWQETKSFAAAHALSNN